MSRNWDRNFLLKIWRSFGSPHWFHHFIWNTWGWYCILTRPSCSLCLKNYGNYNFKFTCNIIFLVLILLAFKDIHMHKTTAEFCRLWPFAGISLLWTDRVLFRLVSLLSLLLIGKFVFPLPWKIVMSLHTPLLGKGYWITRLGVHGGWRSLCLSAMCLELQVIRWGMCFVTPPVKPSLLLWLFIWY